MNKLDQFYRALGLRPGASLEAVNQAYKELVLVWHPDRFPQDDPQLQQEAHEKLQELNQARDQLRSHRPAARTNVTKTHSQSAAKASTKPEPVKAQYTPPSAHAQPAKAKTSQTTQTAHKASTQPPPRYYKQPQPHYSYGPPTPQAQAHKSRPDLSGTNLSGADLQERDFAGRNLSNANLSSANLSDAFLHKVDLNGANLQRANLRRANLLEANLSHANLREANLIGADLSGADLSGADLSGARMGFSGRLMVKLTGANLVGTVMPDGTIHS